MLPWLALVDIGLRTAGLRRTRRWLLGRKPSAAAQPCAPIALAHAQRLAALTAVVGRLGPYRVGCLRQALTVEYFLRRRGLPAQLRIGARKSADGQFDAHAWVELDGAVLGQPQPLHAPINGIHQRLR